MIIYNSVAEFNAAEGAQASEQGEFSAVGELDWAYRLRGAGAPGGQHGWLLAFLLGDRFERNPGWLIAYEIVSDTKTGRVALLRRGWTSDVDKAELERARRDPEWDHWRKHEDGEADIDHLDHTVAGTVLTD